MSSVKAPTNQGLQSRNWGFWESEFQEEVRTDHIDAAEKEKMQ